MRTVLQLLPALKAPSCDTKTEESEVLSMVTD